MKRFNRICILSLILLVLIWVAANAATYFALSQHAGKEYIVEINRLSRELRADENVENHDLTGSSYVTRLSWLPADAPADAVRSFFDGSSTDPGRSYLIKPLYDGDTIKGYVRYEYTLDNPVAGRTVYVLENGLFAALFLYVLGQYLYIRRQILMPFGEMQDLPVQLSKGRLNNGLKENKNRFFGRFVWGLDLLRESISAQKQKELALEKERKTMILSISHGIKTPLSAILLYAKALSDNLYTDDTTRRQTALAITDNARQIEKLVAEIVESQTEDIIDIEVLEGEYYLSDLIRRLIATYKEKLALIHTDFQIDAHPNLLLKGDLERLLDVFENLIENAIKYGDGREIRLTFAREDNSLLIAVTNTGTPIPPLENTHVFESFWRGSNAHDKPGNGLGLYICKHIMSKMHGDIYIEKIEDGMRFVVVVEVA
jgi:signal transduction histidine kinase